MDLKIEHGGAVFLNEDDFRLGEGNSENGLELAVGPGRGKDLVVGVEAVGIVESHSNLKIYQMFERDD